MKAACSTERIVGSRFDRHAPEFPMPSDIPLPIADEQVLATLNPDGSRRWLTPRLADGVLYRRRRIVAWVLILLFAVLPWLRLDGQPPILLDVMTRRFVFLGTVFRPTDTLLLALLLLALFTAIFLLTAIVGRVWCGWGCPQTVYLEFVYRPIEKFFMGRAYGKRGAKVAPWRLLAMYAAFALVSAHLANTFLAYFVGTDRLVGWTLGSPAAHPTAFTVFAVTTGLMLFDFAFFREQLCTLVCPYGRFQSVLLDRDSLIVGYDARRGEPRGPMRGGRIEPGRGDCVDCSLCVQVCPTGIDIRKGLQMECINCAQCIDACNGVMRKIGRPPGLIRTASQRSLEGDAPRFMRLRLVVYSLLLVGFITTLVALLVTRRDADMVQKRTPGIAYRVLEDGRIRAPLHLRLDNRTDQARRFEVASLDPLCVLDGPTAVEAGPNDSADLELAAIVPADAFVDGRRRVPLRVTDDRGEHFEGEVTVLGPLGALSRTPSGGSR